MTYIPYPGAAAGLQDLMGGRIAVIVEGLGTLLGPIQGGTLKPLAISSLKRLPDFPILPTVSETLPGFEATGWFALVAPKGTPDQIVQQVHGELNEVLGARGEGQARGPGYDRAADVDRRHPCISAQGAGGVAAGGETDRFRAAELAFDPPREQPLRVLMTDRSARCLVDFRRAVQEIDALGIAICSMKG